MITPHLLPSPIDAGKLTTVLATMDGGQPWVPHGDKTSEPRS